MAILQSTDLLVVYKPELGFVSTLTTDNINYSDLLSDTGEVYSVPTSPQNQLLNDAGDEVTHDSVAQQLTVNTKIRSGVIIEFYVVSAGFGYVVGELVGINGGDQVIKVDSINEIGGVVEASLYSGEGGYTITTGLLTDFPFGYHSTLMNITPPLEGGESTGNFVDIKVDDSEVVGVFVGTKTFDSDTEFGGDKFKVGEEVHILGNKTVGGIHIISHVKSVLGVESGGPAKFSVQSLESDVKSWAEEVIPTLDVVVQENDGSLDHGGDLGYNLDTGELTYVKSYNPNQNEGSIDLDSTYGQVVDENGVFTSVEIDSQQKLNEQLMRRIKFLESLVYDTDTTNNLLKDEVVLKDGAMSYDQYENPVTGVRQTNRIATVYDLSLVEFIATGAASEASVASSILNALQESNTFEELKAALFDDE